MTKSEFIYTTYIKTTPEKLWDALTNTEFMKQYWFGMYCTSTWKEGSSWKMQFQDGELCCSGEITESQPPKRLVIKWLQEKDTEMKAEGYSLCVFDIEQDDGAVKLTVTHGMDRAASKSIQGVSGGWPKVLSNLKSLLETGEAAVNRKGDCRTQAA
jgi:uncharacterized protein YndB with AHSA1/START domain